MLPPWPAHGYLPVILFTSDCSPSYPAVACFLGIHVVCSTQPLTKSFGPQILFPHWTFRSNSKSCKLSPVFLCPTFASEYTFSYFFDHWLFRIISAVVYFYAGITVFSFFCGSSHVSVVFSSTEHFEPPLYRCLKTRLLKHHTPISSIRRTQRPAGAAAAENRPAADPVPARASFQPSSPYTASRLFVPPSMHGPSGPPLWGKRRPPINLPWNILHKPPSHGFFWGLESRWGGGLEMMGGIRNVPRVGVANTFLRPRVGRRSNRSIISTVYFSPYMALYNHKPPLNTLSNPPSGLESCKVRELEKKG